jgi:hypothetical protein
MYVDEITPTRSLTTIPQYHTGRQGQSHPRRIDLLQGTSLGSGCEGTSIGNRQVRTQ